VLLWDLASGQLMAPLTITQGSPQAGVSALVISPDGQHLAWSNSGAVILLWNIQAVPPSLEARLSGHAASVTSLDFSRDGNFLVSGGADGTLELWNVVTHVLVGAPLVGHGAPVNAVAFSPDGATLASASADQTVILWQISASLQALAVQDPVERACQLAGRNLTRSEWDQYLTSQTYRKTCDQWPEGN
jgi:WD40 repeat protein